MKTPFILTACMLASSLLSACITRTSFQDLYGQAIDVAAPVQHVIVIHPDTRHVNIQGGDAVRFMAGGKSFAWQFNVARTIDSFDLREVAPPGMLDHAVIAYVSPDPKYLGMP
ncbi:CzcE family metal-binding protein [Noviherbaspirillum sp. CPCC 100848]|uniref:CzcE family metal-binding protein n=2 Tax=Noviherbaspirillum album TaxID=3080276 RepID=A0ABU6JB84_9BURK|nr:CzcE family metal-binding protein [Noviherbaspirillum sp. CPCC 100848]